MLVTARECINNGNCYNICMKDERVDIVDENCNILYSTTKQGAHEKGLLHKTVIAEIINSKGEYMLVRPFSHKQDVGQYVSPMGGHVKSGESDEEALKREMAEELNFRNFQYRYKGRTVLNRQVLNRQENHFFIVYEVFSDQTPVLGDETASYRWFTREEIKKRLVEKREDFGEAFLFLLKNLYLDSFI